MLIKYGRHTDIMHGDTWRHRSRWSGTISAVVLGIYSRAPFGARYSGSTPVLNLLRACPVSCLVLERLRASALFLEHRSCSCPVLSPSGHCTSDSLLYIRFFGISCVYLPRSSRRFVTALSHFRLIQTKTHILIGVLLYRHALLL